jgi:L-lactate dehydrogenase complex protein LldF
LSHDLLTGTTLRQRTASATADQRLRTTLQYVTDRLATSRVAGAGGLDNWEALRDAARAQRADIIARLPDILAQLADRWEANGGKVFWAADAEEARRYVSQVVARRQAKVVVKSKSMATEEIGLNDVLEAQGVEVVETDLGEWIIQLADQPPSHIIAPAIHLTRDDVRDIFNREPASAGALSNVPEELCAFAREQLREKFLAADVGISGCNMAVAETGSMVLVTNEGNGRMVTSLPPVHIAVMGMERVVETWEQLDLIMALLPRAATGQDLSVYTTQVTGPRRPGEIDGPDELHLVILDNGRSELIGGEFQEMLNCIRCGACLNVCPVYRQVGGHAYGWCYSGPMGAVLIPLLNRAEEAGELSGASTLCGACYDACPVKIPLQDLLLALRRKRVAEEAPRTQRLAWKAWATAWSHPTTYRASAAAAAGVGRVLPTKLFPEAWAAGREVPRARHGPSFRQRLARGEI